MEQKEQKDKIQFVLTMQIIVNGQPITTVERESQVDSVAQANSYLTEPWGEPWDLDAIFEE